MSADILPSDHPRMIIELPDTPDWRRVEMLVVPPGKFLMGSTDAEERWHEYDGREEPQHEVTIRYTFAMAKYPITVGQFGVFLKESRYDIGSSARIRINNEWVEVIGKGWHDPGFKQTIDHPVCCVSWHDAHAFLAWLNRRLESAPGAPRYRLPSESEWEYACRAGTTTPFSFGTTVSCEIANYDSSYSYGGSFTRPARGGTSAVGSYSANPLGLFDMHGNVCEWCEDVWHTNYDGAPTDGSPWLEGGDPQRRVLRGGSWSYAPRGIRSANRGKYDALARKGKYGFRLACSMT